MCSKPLSCSTCSVPPRVAQVSFSLDGLFNPEVLSAVVELEPELELELPDDPQADSRSPQLRASIAAAILVIDLTARYLRSGVI
jgi:hypothetical protein